MIAGERSERFANLVSGDMEGTTNPVDNGAVAGPQGGGGIRCFSSTRIRTEPQEKQNPKKKYPTDPYSSPTEFEVLPCQDVPLIPLPLPDCSQPPLSSLRPYDASTISASWAASYPRPALAVVGPCQVGSGGRSSKDSFVLGVGKDQVQYGGEAGKGAYISMIEW